MVGNHQHAARFERLEQPHGSSSASTLHERRVVISKAECDQIGSRTGRDWIVIVSQDAYDVPHRSRFRTLVERSLALGDTACASCAYTVPPAPTRAARSSVE